MVVFSLPDNTRNTARSCCGSIDTVYEGNGTVCCPARTSKTYFRKTEPILLEATERCVVQLLTGIEAKYIIASEDKTLNGYLIPGASHVVGCLKQMTRIVKNIQMILASKQTE